MKILLYSAFTIGLLQFSPLVTAQTSSMALPELGSNAFSTLSPEKEKHIGDVMIRQAKAMLPMVHDPLLDEYLHNLGQRLVSKAEGVRFPFNFYWINEKEINAFATLGGHIATNTGTLAIADSESEFASVMAHEITHVTQRHIARAAEARAQAGPLTLASLLGSILLATVNPEAGMAGIMASQGAAQQAAINFTRGNEQEADRIGIQLLVNAGFDPYAVPDFFHKLNERSRYGNTRLAFLYTHPLSSARIADTRIRVQQYDKRFVADSADFAMVKARIWARYQLSSGEAKVHFEKLLNKPGGNTKANQYGLALSLLDLGDAKAAQVILDKLRDKDANNLYVLDAYTDVLLAQKQYDKALNMLEQQYLLRPNNQVITLNYANAALQAKSYRLALHLLKNLLYYKPDNFLAYQMMIDVYKGLNDNARYFEARADLKYQVANYPGAIDDLNEALNHVDSEDSLENRRIEAKKKLWQTEFNRLRKLN